MGIAPDGSSLYTTVFGTSTVRQVSLTGVALLSFTVTGSAGGNCYFTVAPSTVPEPGSALLLAGGVALLGLLRRRG